MIDALPTHVAKYSETRLFDETTIPENVRTSHRTKETVWGKLVVRSGALEYVVPGPPERTRVVEAGDSVIIEPAVEHYVRPSRKVTFLVEFYR